jgi:hypothetical protein
MKISVDIGGTLTKICLFIPDLITPFLTQEFVDFLSLDIIKNNKILLHSPYVSPSVSPNFSSLSSPFSIFLGNFRRHQTLRISSRDGTNPIKGKLFFFVFQTTFMEHVIAFIQGIDRVSVNETNYLYNFI